MALTASGRFRSLAISTVAAPMDTPISASVAEGCADLFQVFYNYLETVREAPTELVEEATETLREDFAQYWARTLCNVLRAVNAVRYR